MMKLAEAQAWLAQYQARRHGVDVEAFPAIGEDRAQAAGIAELLAHLARREAELLEANNRYLDRARTAEHALVDRVFSPPAEMSASERIRLAHGVVTDAKRDLGEGGLELLLEAAMMNLILAAGTGTGRKVIDDMANKVAVLCGQARPGTVALTAVG